MAEKTRASTINQTSDRSNSQRQQTDKESSAGQSRFGANLFEQALDNYAQALKAGVRFQEESTKWWTSVLNETSWANQWQKAANGSGPESVIAAQRKWMEDTMRIVEQHSSRSLDLLKKASDAAGSLSPAEAQKRLQDLWENSLLLLRSNAESMAAANEQAMEGWVDFMRRSSEMATPAAAGK